MKHIVLEIPHSLPFGSNTRQNCISGASKSMQAQHKELNRIVATLIWHPEKNQLWSDFTESSWPPWFESALKPWKYTIQLHSENKHGVFPLRLEIGRRGSLGGGFLYNK